MRKKRGVRKGGDMGGGRRRKGSLREVYNCLLLIGLVTRHLLWGKDCKVVVMIKMRG